jgi:hypothetical protein
MTRIFEKDRRQRMARIPKLAWQIVLFLSPALVAAQARAGDAWRYVVPPAGDAFAHPPLIALALQERRPDGLEETVRYRGSRRRYAHLVYGRGRTAGVAVVLDEVGPGKFDLYVDADRDRAITAKDRVAGEGLSWRTPLKAVVHEGDVLHEYPRTVAFRFGVVSKTLAVATCGYVEGRARLGGREVRVRRTDGDADGFFASAQDRVWVDLDGDGQWDPALEEFLFAPILRLGGRRVAVRADTLGERLSFAPLEGSGRVRLELPRTLPAQQVEEIQATVQSRDGVVACLRGVDTEAVLPTGDYRVSALLLTLKDPAGGPGWGYVFNDNGGKPPRWHTLKQDGQLTLDPIGALDFTAEVGDGKAQCRAGETLSVKPALYTGDGLLIERAYRGHFAANPFGGGCGGDIRLLAADRSLDSAHCGFA